MGLERLKTYPFSQIGVDEDALDGPYLMSGGHFGLLVSLRGKDGGAMPSADELRWGREVPARVRTEPVHVFVRRDDGALYLGEARYWRPGRPSRDGFRALFHLEDPPDESTWRELVAQASAPPPPAAEEAITSLRPNATADERAAAMRVFAARWFGCDAEAPELELPVPAPRPLHVLYGLVAGRRVCAQNELVAPAELAVEDGKLPFYVENQGVYVWATDPEGEDPAVYVRADGQATWQLEAERLSGFVIQVLLQEAVLGSPFGASTDALEPDELAALTRRLPAIPIPPWSSSRTRFLGRHGVIGLVYPDEDGLGVWLGARDRLRMEAVEDLVADWPDVRF